MSEATTTADATDRTALALAEARIVDLERENDRLRGALRDLTVRFTADPVDPDGVPAGWGR